MKRCGPCSVVFLASFSLLAMTCNAWAAGSAYTFSINGQPVTPQHYSLNADPSVFAPGDVIYVGDKEFDYGGLFMTLGEEKDCRFVTASGQTSTAEGRGAAPRPSPRDSRVFLQLPDGRRKVVRLKVSWTVRQQPIDSNDQTQSKSQGAKKQPSSERIPYNPLDSMSPEEIHGLWGIAFVQWPQGIEQELAHVDTDRVCLTVHEGAGPGGKPGASGAGRCFPRYRRKLAIWSYRERAARAYTISPRWPSSATWCFFKFRSFASEPLDAGWICQNASLRCLDISGCGFSNHQKLASLTELRYLDISRCQDFDNLEFVKDMRQLRTLCMGLTRISNLSPLDNSDAIREIYAGAANVRDLPKGDLASLRAVNLTSTKVDPQAVSQFRKAHPTCKVEYGWAEALRSVLQGTTKLRIRSGGTCHRRIEEEKTLAEITRPEEIERFLDGIHIDEAGSNFYCGCCGNPTFEFYTGDRLLATVGYHHGVSLRWADGSWPADGLLTTSSQVFTVSWLSQHGVDGPRQARAAAQKYQAEQEKIENRYVELIPQQTRAAVSEAQRSKEISWARDSSGVQRRKLMAEAFQGHEKDAVTSVALYLRVLGVRSSGSSSAFYEYDSVIVENVLPRFKGADLAQGAIRAMDDDEGAGGAARWFFGQDGWRNLDESDRLKILPQLAQGSLQHPVPNARKKTMAALMLIRSEWATALLRGVLSRPTGISETPSTKGDYGWRIDLGDGDQLWSNEYSDAAWAAFCLAKRGDRSSLSSIEKLAAEAQGKDKDLLNKALQLLQKNADKPPDHTK